MTGGAPPVPLATRLRAALKEAGFSQRGFAKTVVEVTGGNAEHERRQIMRYLKGQTSPEPERARLYARLLEKPEDYFIDEQPTRVVDLMGDLRAVVGDLTKSIEADGRVESLEHRLESLEATVRQTSRATAKALARLEAAIVRLSEQQPPAAQEPPQKAAR